MIAVLRIQVMEVQCFCLMACSISSKLLRTNLMHSLKTGMASLYLSNLVTVCTSKGSIDTDPSFDA